MSCGANTPRSLRLRLARCAGAVNRSQISDDAHSDIKATDRKQRVVLDSLRKTFITGVRLDIHLLWRAQPISDPVTQSVSAAKARAATWSGASLKRDIIWRWRVVQISRVALAGWVQYANSQPWADQTQRKGQMSLWLLLLMDKKRLWNASNQAGHQQ